MKNLTRYGFFFSMPISCMENSFCSRFFGQKDRSEGRTAPKYRINGAISLALTSFFIKLKVL
jgi:hypothetical protein